MSATQKILAASGFLVVLLSLGAADGFFTRDSLRIPALNADGGVTKQPELDMKAMAQAEGFSLAETSEEFLLQKILPPGSPIPSGVLLKDNDRVAAIAWLDSADVKQTLGQLKERLRSSFSPLLRDLIDETQSEPGKPPRDILSFRDPAIHSNRVLFVRVRQRLYEFHLTDGKESAVDRIVNVLTE